MRDFALPIGLILAAQPEEVERRRIMVFGRNGYRGKTSQASCAGWREIGGKRFYFRSRWEINYAFYLEWQKVHGLISEWEFESTTFWFEKIRRGTRSYLPDFIVTEKDGSRNIREVKGYMDSRSATKLKRMAKYHPSWRIFVIDETWFRANAPKLKALVPGWEVGTKKSY